MVDTNNILHIDTIFQYSLDPDDLGEMVYIGKKEDPRRCRFCGKSAPEVSFKKEAHIIPNSFGNRRLFSHEECDICNAKYGETLDNDLAAMLAPDRALSRLKGSKETTKFRPFELESYLEGSTTSNKVTLMSKDGENTIQLVRTGEKSMDLKIKVPKFRPADVVRNLARMAIAVAPESELSKLSNTLAWVNKERDWNPFYYRGFIPGPGLDIVGIELLKISFNDIECYEFTFIFSTCILTLPIPGANGLIFSNPLNSIYRLNNQYGPITADRIKITGEEKGPSEVTIGINFERAIEIIPDSDVR
jgi:hypothetical protein